FKSSSRPESQEILGRVHKAVDHSSIIPAILIHSVDPLKVENVRVAAKITEVLHHNERLVVELLIDCRVFYESSEKLCASHCPVRERNTGINDRRLYNCSSDCSIR